MAIFLTKSLKFPNLFQNLWNFPTFFLAIFLQTHPLGDFFLNHLDDEFVKKMPEKKGGKFQDFVKKMAWKKEDVNVS